MTLRRKLRIGNKGDDHEDIPVLKVVVLVLLVIVGITLVSQSRWMGQSAFKASVMQSSNTTAGNSIREMVESSFQAQPKLISPGKYPPFSCLDLLHDMRNSSAMKARDPNSGMMYARRTETAKPFYISLHKQEFDRTRWCVMDTGHYYERELTRAFQEVLRQSPPGSRVLDVGGNIGFFSLVSAAEGPFKIDAFEPNIKNRMRFCESLNMNRWHYTEFNHPLSVVDRQSGSSSYMYEPPIVNLYPYGVGKEEGTFTFIENMNPGQGAVSDAAAVEGAANSVQLVTLDAFARERGWFESRPHIAIMKVDVEGFEPSVIEGAKELLKSHLIRNVFMEVSVRNEPEREKQIPMIKHLSEDAGYKVLKVGGWPGPGKPVSWPNDANLVNNILDTAAKEGARQLNVWWTVQNDESSTV